MAEGTTPITTNTEPEPSEKTFTQEEVNSIVAKRLAKATKGMPTEDELNAYRTWKESQQTEAQKLADAIAARDANKVALDSANAEITALKHANYIASKGLSGDEAEFIAFKAEKLVDDKTTFEQAVDSLVKERKPTFDWSAPLGGGKSNQTANTLMNKIIRDAVK